MAQLLCEICGGNISAKSGGVFSCDVCGMEYSKERIQEIVRQGGVNTAPTPAPQPTVSNENYLELAESALDAENNAEAESYCNKILETDPKNYKAWLIKGRAAGWQSTLQNIRFPETVNCFIKAYELADDTEKVLVKAAAMTQITALSKSLIALRCERFTKWPDKEEATGFVTDLTAITKAKTQFISSTKIQLAEDDASLTADIISAINSAITQKINPDYFGTDNHPSDYDWQTYIQRMDNCIDVLTALTKLSGLSDSVIKLLYSRMVDFQNLCIDSCSFSYETVEKQGGFLSDYETYYENEWLVHLTLSDSAKAARRTLISQYRNEIRKIEQKEEAAKQAALNKAIADSKERFWKKYTNEQDLLISTKQALTKLKSKYSYNYGFDNKSILELINKRIREIDAILNKDRRSSYTLIAYEQKNINDLIKGHDEFVKKIKDLEETKREEKKKADEEAKILENKKIAYYKKCPKAKELENLERKKKSLETERAVIISNYEESNDYKAAQGGWVIALIVAGIGAVAFLVGRVADSLFGQIVGCVCLVLVLIIGYGSFKSGKPTRKEAREKQKEINSITKQIKAIEKEIPTLQEFINNGTTTSMDTVEIPKHVVEIPKHVVEIPKHVVEIPKSAKVRDYISFGRYEQGTSGKEDIEWLVLDVQEEKILVISRYAIDCKPYNTSNPNTPWETSTLRKWLNNDFINAAFSDKEKSKIITTTLSADTSVYVNSNDPEDQIFLLSIDECKRYFHFDHERCCEATKYAISRGAYTVSATNTCWWWLRTSGSSNGQNATVDHNGKIFTFTSVTSTDTAVRPAIWIDISKLD